MGVLTMYMGFRLAVVLAMLATAAAPLSAQDSSSCVGGSSSAPIKIEVFSDYQCPACQQFYLQTMRTVLSEYADKNKACVVYREFPLSQHAHSRVAARYGLAALHLGVRQWSQVSDALFLGQDGWAASGDIESVVAKVLSPSDMAAVRKELQNPAALDANIEADYQLGVQRGVNSTPTFFVIANGKTQKFAAAYQYPILKRYLDSLLAAGN